MFSINASVSPILLSVGRRASAKAILKSPVPAHGELSNKANCSHALRSAFYTRRRGCRHPQLTHLAPVQKRQKRMYHHVFPGVEYFAFTSIRYGGLYRSLVVYMRHHGMAQDSAFFSSSTVIGTLTSFPVATLPDGNSSKKAHL